MMPLLETDRPEDPVLTDRVLNEVLEMSTRINNSAFLLGAEAARLGPGFAAANGALVTNAPIVNPAREAEGAGTLDTLIARSRESLVDVHRTLLELGSGNAGGHYALRALQQLAPLTPSPFRVLQLAGDDLPKALTETARYMEAVDARLEAARAFFTLHFVGRGPAEIPAGDSHHQPPRAAPPSFEQIRDDLLRQAGGSHGLAEAASLLGISRQAMHKRINADSALGMMLDKQIVLPKLQFVAREGGLEIVPGLRDVLAVFREGKASGWPALQFLAAGDPNLDGKRPIDELKAGEVEDVVQAARVHLDLDSD